jgi:peroxiredoxin
MGLDDLLSAERDRRNASEAMRIAYEEVVGTLGANGFLSNVLAEEAPFPDFVLPDTEGRLVALSDHLARGPVIVQFFRGVWCPYCKLMLNALVETLPEIRAAGASLLALTPEIGPWARAAKPDPSAPFTVLSDVDCGVGLAAGVVFRIPPIYHALISRAGVDIGDRHGNGADFLPVPAAFVLDGDGRVAWRFINVDFTRRAAPERILAALQRLNGAQRG